MKREDIGPIIALTLILSVIGWAVVADSHAPRPEGEIVDTHIIGDLKCYNMKFNTRYEHTHLVCFKDGVRL